MSFFDDQFRTANNFLDLLDRPRQFRQQLRNDFFNNMNQSRETFVENQRVPERLSQTALGLRQNEFDLAELNQNFGVNLETSGLLARTARDDARFTNENGATFRDANLSGARRTIVDNSTAIEERAAKDRFQEIVEQTPFVQGSSGADYYRTLIDNSLSEPNHSAIRQLIIDDFKNRLFRPQAAVVDRIISDYQSVLLAEPGSTRHQGLLRRIQANLGRVDPNILEFASENGLIELDTMTDLRDLANGLQVPFDVVPTTVGQTGQDTVGGVPAPEVVTQDGQPVLTPEQAQAAGTPISTGVDQTTSEEPEAVEELTVESLLQQIRNGSELDYEILSQPVTEESADEYTRLRALILDNELYKNNPEVKRVYDEILNQRDGELTTLRSEIIQRISTELPTVHQILTTPIGDIVTPETIEAIEAIRASPELIQDDQVLELVEQREFEIVDAQITQQSTDEGFENASRLRQEGLVLGEERNISEMGHIGLMRRFIPDEKFSDLINSMDVIMLQGDQLNVPEKYTSSDISEFLEILRTKIEEDDVFREALVNNSEVRNALTTRVSELFQIASVRSAQERLR